MPMPSEVVDQKGSSSLSSEVVYQKGSSSLSSYFSDDVRLENETLQRQVNCWNSANMPDYHGQCIKPFKGVVSCRLMKNTTTHHKSAGSGTVASSSEKLLPAEQNSLKSVDHHDSFLFKDQKVELISNKQSVGVERKGSHSTNLLKTDFDIGTQSLQPSYLAQRNKFNVIGAQCESSLFSSSLSELFTKRVTLSSNNALYGHSVDTVASLYEEEEPLESIEELEAQTIGNLLPNDDDLLSGLTDGVDYVLTQNEGEDTEDLDFFSNVGGMDLGDEDLSMGLKNSEFYGVSHGQQVTSNGSIGVEHPLGEHPSRTLFVRNISSSVEDSELRALFEQYGDIHTLYTACKHRGFVMISYYDIRGAQNAMKALQNKPLRRRKLNIHFSIPKDNPSEKDINHGSFVVLNLDSKISNDELFQIFGAYGEVKEVKEVPHKSCHKIIEFYDIRAVEPAVRALNWGDILGKQIKLEPNYPVGGRWSLAQQFHPEMEKEDLSSYLQQNSSPMNSAIGLSGLNSKVSNICSSVDNGSLLGLHSALRLKSLDTASNNGISSSVPINLSSQMRAESIANKSVFVDSGHSPSLLKFQAAHAFHPHSLPEYHDGFHGRVHFNTHEPTAGNISLQLLEKMDNHQQLGISSNGNAIALSEAFGSGGKGNCSLPGHKYTWGNSYHPHPTGMVWPNSPSYVNGIRPGHPPSQLQGVPRAPAHMIPSVLPISNHYVGSAPSVNPSFWDRHNPYVVESPEFSGFLPGSLGNRKVSNDSAHSIDFVSHIFAQAGGSCVDLPITERNVGLQPHHQRCMIFPARNQILPSMISFDYPSERSRSRRNESFSSQVENKKQYELDIDRIRLGEDIRTTLMIKNIPNKYTSKMLLAAIDECHRGVYDFIYLPIDFKNKCNVGYAFINMTDPSLIIPFHQTLNGKKWEKFNSEKVAYLAYARIQGKAALVAHFQNSSLMNEDKRCRPILFNTEGPNAGDQVPFPTGVNVRTRPGKARSNACEESHSDSPYDSINGDDCFIEDTPYGSTKVSDPRPQQLDFCESLTNRTD